MEIILEDRAKNHEGQSKQRGRKGRRIENAEEEKFDKILDFCGELLSDAMRGSDRDIFELLDPLISDTQCHMHATLLLNILHKCYDETEATYHGFEKLEEKEKRILSYGVLFSLLKLECRDEFGVVVYEASIDYFDRRIIFSTRKREKYRIRKAKEEFNAISVDYIKSVSCEEIKDIFNSCQASSLISHLKYLPCYASIWAVIDYVKDRELPIIVSLTIIDKKLPMGADSLEYKLKSNDVRFYEFREDMKKFVHKINLNEPEKQIPTITLYCYSLVNEGDSTEFLIDYDPADLLLSSASSHSQLPRSCKLPAGYENANEYVDDLFKHYDTFFIAYKKHREFAKKKNLVDARYSIASRSSGDDEDDGVSVTIKRRGEDTFFNVDHICVSNYAREFQRLSSLNFCGKVSQNQVFKLIEKTANFVDFSRIVFEHEQQRG